jgi:hypothetical protein
VTGHIDKQISDAVGLVGLLLVFVAGYLTATWTNASDLTSRPIPTIATDRARLRSRVVATRAVAVGALVSIVAVILLLVPLSVDVVSRVDLDSEFNTLRAGLLLVDAFLVSLAVAAAVLIHRLNQRAAALA